MPTLKEVAAAAGVSLGTASQALSGRGRVSRTALEKVAKAAAELGYVYKSAIGGNQPINGIISLYMNIGASTNPYDSFFYRIVVPITDACSKSGFGIMVFPCNEKSNGTDYFTYSAEGSDYAGVILYSLLRGTEKAFRRLIASKRPIVMIGDAIESLPSVTIDNRGAMEKGINHLYAMGHKDIAYITARRASTDTFVIDDEERYKGYSDALIRRGLRPNLIFGEQLAKCLSDVKEGKGPTAVACFDDNVAIGIIEAAEGMGIAVPGELSVLGFGDHPYAVRAYPRLTTIHQPVEEHAVCAARLLIDQIATGAVADYDISLHCRLVARGTCAPPEMLDLK
jgi:DNA-binding LacI/PurR family transcriptional regulator